MLCDLQIFSGGVHDTPSASSHAISFRLPIVCGINNNVTSLFSSAMPSVMEVQPLEFRCWGMEFNELLCFEECKFD